MMTEESRGHYFDELSRGLASGDISRRKALRLLGATLVGGAVASIPGVAQAAPQDTCAEANCETFGETCCATARRATCCPPTRPVCCRLRRRPTCRESVEACERLRGGRVISG